MRYLFALDSFHNTMVPNDLLRPRFVFVGTKDEFRAFLLGTGGQKFKEEIVRTMRIDPHCAGIRIQLFSVDPDGFMGMNSSAHEHWKVCRRTGEVQFPS